LVNGAFMPRILIAVLLFLLLTGCSREKAGAPAKEVTLYTSVDQPVAEPIAKEFERRTGIHVRLVSDTEATKSAGLAARLLAEKANPQADVFWGNEVFHTINLARNGALAAYDSPAAKTIPDRYKDAGHRWAGTCLRARVIGVSGVVTVREEPRWMSHVEALTEPLLKGRVGIARPTAGTTGGHVAALYAVWGREKADKFFRGLHANEVRVLGGNSVVAEQIGQGQLVAGLTDNDDVAATAKAGGSIALRLPDQAEGELGTLTIPCTVAVVASAPHADAAKQLADYLLSDEVEQKLIAGGFGQYGVRAAGAQSVRAMDVTYEKVAENIAWAPNRAAALLEGREPPAGQ
jgi:iron(III) transport system substrate-binding protein